jgi:hypothetical protein
VSVKVSNWAWHDARDREGNKITGNDLILLLALADVADDSGRSRYAPKDDGLTNDALAEKTGVAKRTIIRTIARLVDEGLIEYKPGVKGKPNEFVCLIPGAVGFGDTLAPNGDSDSVTSAQDSVTTATGFGDNARTRTSLRRIDVTTDVGAAPKRALASGTRIPQPFVVTPKMVAWAREHAPLVDGPRSTLRFENYWIAKTGKDATKRDWERTWQNWLLKDQEDAERRPGAKATPTDRALATIALGREQKAVGA